MKKQLLFFAFYIYFVPIFAQIGINTSGSAPNASAALDVDWNNRGVLIPRIALTQTTSASPITSPATSLLVYNTATVNDVTPGYYYWNGSSWQRFATGTITVANLTFNNSGSGAPSGTVYNGTTAQTISYNTIGAVGGSGTATRVAFWSGTNTLSSNANFYWDNTNSRLGIGTTTPGFSIDVVGNGRLGLASGIVQLGSDGNAYIEMRESDNAGVPYIDLSNDNTSDYDARMILENNNQLSFLTSTNGRQLSVHSTGIALSGTNKYINFNTTFDAAGYGFRDNGGTLEYKHSGGTWTPFSQPPSIPGNTEWWVRPTGAQYIQPMYNQYARVYDNAQPFGFYYDGNNDNGGFFAGWSNGLMGTRGSSSDIPNWGGDVFPWQDANGDGAISNADNLTYTGVYGWGSSYMGVTGAGRLDAGVRGIGLGGTSGTNSSWPVVGVIGEVIATGTSNNGQQGVYGWQAAPPGNAPTCLGVVGRTSQTGNQSAGVGGYYTNTVGNLVTHFSSFQTMGLLGSANYGALGQSGLPNTYGVVGINTDLTNSNNVGVQGQVGNGTSVPVDFKGIVGISNNTHNNYGIGGYFQGEHYGVYASNPTTSQGFAVYYSGNLAGTGTKSCIMKTSQGPKALYCVESPENYFEDYGTAKLVNGRARIDIDPIFLETITISDEYPYKVFIQMIDEIPNNVHIVKNDTYFEVIENNQGTSTATFDWRLVAKRRGFEKLRLKDAPEAYTDPALYPDPNDPSIPSELRKKVQDNFEFLKHIQNVPVQKHEAETKSNIDKSTLNKKK